MVVNKKSHHSNKALLPSKTYHLECMQNFVGLVEYLCSWQWKAPGVVCTADGFIFEESALPLVVSDKGDKQTVSDFSSGEVGAKVFMDDKEAFVFLMILATRDLQYRGFRDERVTCFQHKQDASFLLYRHVANITDLHEYKCLQQRWDSVNRPKYRDMAWSTEQSEALRIIHEGYTHEDEQSKLNSHRWLYVEGPPGSGKTAVLIEAAIRASRYVNVLVI